MKKYPDLHFIIKIYTKAWVAYKTHELSHDKKTTLRDELNLCKSERTGKMGHTFFHLHVHSVL